MDVTLQSAGTYHELFDVEKHQRAMVVDLRPGRKIPMTEHAVWPILLGLVALDAPVVGQLSILLPPATRYDAWHIPPHIRVEFYHRHTGESFTLWDGTAVGVADLSRTIQDEEAYVPQMENPLWPNRENTSQSWEEFFRWILRAAASQIVCEAIELRAETERIIQEYTALPI